MLRRPIAAAIVLTLLLAAIGAGVWMLAATPGVRLRPGQRLAPVAFNGGYEIDDRDGGRPVVLIAAALGVEPEVFREAFSRVRPAPGGQEPDARRVRENKETLLRALAPHGVTNERLDEVSDYYRYDRGRGEMWRARPAKAYAIVEGERVVGFHVADGGAGYTSPPFVSVPDVREARGAARLQFGRELDQNGSVAAITLEP